MELFYVYVFLFRRKEEGPYSQPTYQGLSLDTKALFTLHSQYPRTCQYNYFHITQHSLDAQISPSMQRARAPYIE